MKDDAGTIRKEKAKINWRVASRAPLARPCCLSARGIRLHCPCSDMELTTKRADVPCPKCRSEDTWCLEAISEQSDRDFIRCITCLHIWTIARDPVEPPCAYPKPA
jgi:hypothetical protein